jgi:hypothetical protein
LLRLEIRRKIFLTPLTFKLQAKAWTLMTSRNTLWTGWNLPTKMETESSITMSSTLSSPRLKASWSLTKKSNRYLKTSMGQEMECYLSKSLLEPFTKLSLQRMMSTLTSEIVQELLYAQIKRKYLKRK